MVVCDFDLVGITTLPAKADTILLIDTDTVLPDSVPGPEAIVIDSMQEEMVGSLLDLHA